MRFLRRAGWLMTSLWVALVVVAAGNAANGHWSMARVMVACGFLSFYTVWLGQLLADEREQSARLKARVDDLTDLLVKKNVLHAARNPRPDWED